jgi:hypothetical protein
MDNEVWQQAGIIISCPCYTLVMVMVTIPAKQFDIFTPW